MRRGRLSAWVVAALLGVSAVAGCGVPTTDGAQPLPTDLAELAPVQQEQGAVSTPTRVTDLAWVRHGRLRLSPRAVAASDASTQAAAALSAAIAGPTTEELSRGLATEIPPDLQASLALDGTEAVVDLRGPSDAVGGGNVTLATAQLALAVLLVPGVDAVTFTVEGVPAEVPRADGRVRSGPVTLADYATLLDRRSKQ